MTYQLLLTTLGQQKIAAAANAGSQPLRIAEFAVGQGVNVDFSQRLDQQVLVSKRYQGAVQSVTATAQPGHYEISCIVPQNQGGWTIREFGLIDSDGDLIWVGRLPEVQKPAANSTAAVDYRIKAVVSIANPDVALVIDANVIMASQAWVANNFVPLSHLSDIDPHPQYLNNNRFQLLLQTLIPMGYLHHTHEAASPKPLFDELMGIDTAWRRITGKIMLASDPNDPLISTHSLVLGQRGVTTAAESNHPHVYPVQTTNIFERYDPSAPIETVWNVASNKVAIGEGEAVRFTITVNNLPDGQILNWSIKEGELNASNDDITAPEKTDSGTVIIKNSQAVIDFQTVADNNEVDPQKYVRLTVGAPANLSINVPIADTGHNETVVHISQSTNDGIVLDEYYKAQFGAYPLASDNIRFIVDNGVDIVAPDTQTPAIQAGVNWSAESPPTVENRGRILGRGGDGGQCAIYLSWKGVGSDSALYSGKKTAQSGGDGGTAIKGNINVDNFGLIAGGGGGGGGNGAAFAIRAQIYPADSSSGGGAPFGKSPPNRTLPDAVKNDLSSKSTTVLERYNQAEASVIKSLSASDSIDHITVRSDGTWVALSNSHALFNYTDSSIDLTGFTSTWISGSHFDVRYPIPKKLTNAKDVGATLADFDKPNSYVVNTWSSASPFIRPSCLLFHAVNAGLLEGAEGGLGINGTTPIIWSGNTDRSSFTGYVKTINYIPLLIGAKGGNVGEDGNTGRLDKVIFGDASGYKALNISQIPSENIESSMPPAAGGLAGCIKEGNVTIRNLGNGVTKGR